MNLVSSCLIATIWLTACLQQTPEQEQITIAAAANMQFVMEALVKEFTAKTGIGCQTIISSSGKLTAQIKEGAPYDIFASANMKYPEELFRSGMTEAPPKVYAYGMIVLWTVVKDIDPSIVFLTDESVRHIALSNPKTAPYGSAAMEVLDHFDIFDTVQAKLVYGESIAQTNQFITSGAAEMGFTSLSTVLSPEMKERGRWLLIKNGAYQPIRQGVVVIKRDNGNFGGARKFSEFLFSPEAKKILKNYGYLADEPTGRANSNH